MIEVETPQEIEVVPNGVEVGARALDVEVVDLSELDITVAKREFVITGDDIYVPKLYDDAPQWMKDLVDIVVNNAMETGNAATLNEMASMLSQFAVSYVPLNQYTQSILDLSNEDARINLVIETLNSNFNDGLSEANAQIINVQNTKASKDEVIAQVITTLSAQLTNPTSELGATIGRIDQAMVNNQSANALSMQVLTSTLEGLGEDVSGNSTAIQTLSTHVGIEKGVPTGTGLLADVAILQKQNDGVIETYTGTYDVMIGIEDPNNNTDNDQLDATKEPYASWLAEDVANSDIAKRSAHVGDVYIKYSNSESGYKSYERAYKFIKTVVDGTSPYATDSAGFTWSLIVDTDAQNAYVAALNAYDLADDKRRIFVGLGATSTPSVPYDQGDLWLIDATRTVNGYACKVGDILRCIESKGKVATYEENDWVLASSYANAVAAEAAALETWKNTTYASTIATIQTQVDGKAETFYQSSIPTGRIKSINVPTNSTLDKYVGDLWKNTYVGTTGGYLGDNTEYIYTKTANGSNWNYDWTKMEVPDIVFDTIDTKKSIYSGNSVPVAIYPDVIEVNDIWVPSADVPITSSAMCNVANGVWNGTTCSISKYVSGEIYQFSSGGKWVIATKYSTDMEAIKSNLQGQLDGKVETYYQATVPTGMTALNNGDYWYCTADVSTYKKGKVYKYVHATTSWVETADVSRYAFDTADGKASIFTSTNLPTTGYKVNDMLIVVGSFNNGTTTFSDGVVLSSNATRVSGFTASDWVKKINDTEELDAFVNTIYTPAIAGLQTQVDGQVSYYFYDSALGQTAASVSGSASWTTDTLKRDHNGDIAYDTTLQVGYWYDRTTANWVQITGTQNAGVIEALKKAAAAKEAADSVVVSYYAWKQTTAPATQYKWMKDDNTLWEYVGSAWVAVDAKKDDTLTAYENSTKDTTLYVHNGSNWAMITPNGIVANAKAVTDLNASLTSMGTTVSGHTSLLNTVDARIGTEGARVESKFGYDSSLVLNGTTYNSGFGIATSLTTGSGLTTGQSEFWIKADKFKLMSADGSRKSSYSPFTVDSTTGEINFNGKVTFSNVSNIQNSGSNLLYNSAPKIGYETKGWSIGWSNHGLSSAIVAGSDPWRPTGGASVYIRVFGSPAVGSVFDINNSSFPVVAGNVYEASAYISSHRCTSWAAIVWYNSSDAYIGESHGTIVNSASSGALSGWARSTLIVTAPTGAVKGMFYVRSNVTSSDPYCFVSYAFAGKVLPNQTVVSDWSEGTSVSISSGDVVIDINAGNTTTIDGGKITTGSITASQINTVGLIAENINANEIVGKTFTGAVINGARINGAVIKASYLDLDGELEVLTNYHITVAMYNANPSLYTDAVYISADNEYRIPSMSVVREETKNVSLHSVGASSTSLVRSYNTANAGHNSKCVNIRPTLNYNGTVLTITVNVAPFSQWDGAENRLTSYATSLYCFGTFVGRFKLISTTGSGSVVYTQMYVNDVVANSFSVDINGIVFTASLSAGWVGGTSTLTVSISCPNRQLYSNFTSGNILYAVTNNTPSRATSGNAIDTSVSSTSIFTTSSGMTVNNMI